GAGRRSSQRLHRRVWDQGRRFGHGKTGGCCGGSRARSTAPSCDRGGSDGTNLSRVGPSTGSRRAVSTGKHTEDIERETAPRRNQATLSQRPAQRRQGASV